MRQLKPDLKTIALESSLGQSTYAAAQVLVAHSRQNPYVRAEAFLRAWRAYPHPVVVACALRHLRGQLLLEGNRRPLAGNSLLHGYLATDCAKKTRNRFRSYGEYNQVRMREPRDSDDSQRLGDLIILKAPRHVHGEKGVLLIKYSEAIRNFPALFDVARLVRRYMIVLEPSWWGYQDPAFLMFAGTDADVVVQSQASSDFDFIANHGFGLVPTRLGAGDWVDPALFAPSNRARSFDVVVVSSWSPFKRHDDLFGALRQLRQERNMIVRTALIGYPNGWTVEQIHGKLSSYGIADQCSVFNAVPPKTVASIVSQSRLYVLLSRREGANKAMYEALFCDTPVLVPCDHKGINQDHINRRTGLCYRRGDLATGLLAALNQTDQYAPRSWALQHTGYVNSTERLNDTLAELARARGMRWREPIAAKTNRPELRYANDKDRVLLEGAYVDLARYLRV